MAYSLILKTLVPTFSGLLSTDFPSNKASFYTFSFAKFLSFDPNKGKISLFMKFDIQSLAMPTRDRLVNLNISSLKRSKFHYFCHKNYSQPITASHCLLANRGLIFSSCLRFVHFFSTFPRFYVTWA